MGQPDGIAIYTRNHALLILVSVFILFAHACSDWNPQIDIELPQDQRIQDIPLGWCVKELDLDYSARPGCINRAIHYRLESDAKLLQKRDEKAGWKVFLFEYYGHTKRLLIEESYHPEGGNLNIEFIFPPPGIPYKYLIPADYTRLKTHRTHPLAARIYSAADKATIRLYGQGDYCTSMELWCTN